MKLRFVPITLSRNDLLRCQLFGQDIYHRKKGNDRLVCRRDNSRYSIAANVDGKMAELAFARWSGLPVNFVIGAGNDGGIDFKTSGLSIDVKRMGRRFYDLNPLRSKNCEGIKVDIYVLVWPGKSRLELVLVGWTTVEDFLERKIEANYGYGPRWVMRWSELQDMEVLKEMIS